MKRVLSGFVGASVALFCGGVWAESITLDDVTVTNTVSAISADEIVIAAGTREAPLVLNDDAGGKTITVNSGCVLRIVASQTGNIIWKIAGAENAETKPMVIIDSTHAWGLVEGSYFSNVSLVVDSAVKFWLENRTQVEADESVDLEVTEGSQAVLNGTLTIGALTGAGTLYPNADSYSLTLTKDSSYTGNLTAPIKLSDDTTLTVPSGKAPSVTAASTGKVAGVTLVDGSRVYAVREPRTLICSGNIPNWTANTEFSYGEGTSLYALGDTIEFTENSLVYINQGYSAALNIKIDAGKTVTFGHNSGNSDSSRNIPAGSTVTMEEGAKTAFRFWDDDRQGNAIVKNVTFNGGSVVVDGHAKLLRVVNVSGTAPIVLASDDTLQISGSCANTIQGVGTVEVASVQRITLDDAFTGKVVMTVSGFVGGQYPLSLYKKTGSTLELKGWAGWLANETAPEVTVTDPDDSTYGMSISDASSGSEWVYSFPKVKGTGTLATTKTDGDTCQPILLRDVSEFTGKIVVTKQPIIVTDANTRYAAENVGAFIVDEGKSATLTSVTATQVVVNGTLTVSTQLTGVTTTLEGKTIKETDNGDGTYTYAPVAASTWTPVCVDTTKAYDAETNPYAIAGATDLVNLAAAVAAGTYTDVSFRQTADIDMAGVTYAGLGTADHPFAGTFDGAGFTISNLDLGSTQYYNGFIRYLSGTVKGVTVNSVSIANADHVGGAAIVGTANAGARIEGCTAKGAFATTLSYNGAGIVANAFASSEKPTYIVDCTNECNIAVSYGDGKAAGIVAFFNPEGGSEEAPCTLYLTGCVNKGNISLTTSKDPANGAVAGILGYTYHVGNKAVLQNCVNTGTISRSEGTSTDPIAAAFYSYGFNPFTLVDAGGNKMGLTDLALGTTNADVVAISGFDYAKVTADAIETVTALTAGATYTLLRTPAVAPAITLADGESIAFDTTKYQNGAELTDFTGIVDADGKAITPVETAGVLTFTPAESTGLALTLTWDSNVETVSYTIDGETTGVADLSTGSVMVKGIEPGTVVTVAATAKDWYEMKSGTGSVTVDEAKKVEITTALVKTLADIGISNLPGVSVADAKEWADEKELTPAQISACAFAMDAYLMNSDLSARPELKIVGICEVEGGWMITVKGTAGEADIDLGNLNGPLKVKAAATLAGLKTAEGVAYDIDVRENGAAIKIAGDNKNFMQALVTP